MYGFVATFQPDANFGRILAAYGGVFVAGSLLWGMLVDGLRPDRYDVKGVGVCLVGVAAIMYAPRVGALSELACATTVDRPAFISARRGAQRGCHRDAAR